MAAGPPDVESIDCAPRTLSFEDALADVDIDGDGLLTANDLERREIVAIVRWTGSEGPNGRAIHSTVDGNIRMSTDLDWDPVWGVPVPMTCTPRASANVTFFAPDRSIDALSAGDAELFDTGFNVTVHEMAEDPSTVVLDGTMRLTRVDRGESGGGSVEGYLDGSVSATLLRRLGELPWDQTYTIEALAFDVGGTTGPPL